jgi:hypothetical protein
MTALLLRRARGHRPGYWQAEDYDVLDGERSVGRIFLQAHGELFWGVSFMLTGRKSYGDARTREAAMAAFRTESSRWFKECDKQTNK